MIPALFVLITVLIRPDSANAFASIRPMKRTLFHRHKPKVRNAPCKSFYAIPVPLQQGRANFIEQGFLTKHNNSNNNNNNSNGSTIKKSRAMSAVLQPFRALKKAAKTLFVRPYRLKLHHIIPRVMFTFMLLAVTLAPKKSMATAIGGVSAQIKPLTRYVFTSLHFSFELYFFFTYFAVFFSLRKEMIGAFSLWFILFTFIALLHAAEVSITTLWPWKVKEFAEEEAEQGLKHGAFKILTKDVTRVLTTILVTSTACSIYTTTIFTQLVGSLFGHRGERFGAIALTAITLFFVELLPKSIGVNNAEQVARLMVPPVNALATIVGPLGSFLSYLATKTLLMFGLKSQDVGGVTDSELRLIVTGARDSGTIEHTESEMIKGVLNLQDQRVKEIMRPRVEMVAVPRDMSVASVLGKIPSTHPFAGLFFHLI